MSDTQEFSILDFYNNGANEEELVSKPEEKAKAEDIQNIETPEKVESTEPEEESKADEIQADEEESNPKVEKKEKVDSAFLAKAQDEKKKRQALEKEVDALKAQMALLAQQGQQPDIESKKKQAFKEPDTLDDGYTPYIKGLIQNATSEISTRISRDHAIEKWGDDYYKAEEFFLEKATDEEKKHALKQSNPAKYVYEKVKHFQKVQEVSNPDFKKNLEAELREKIKQELLAESGGRPQKEKPRSQSLMGKSDAKQPLKESTGGRPKDALDFYNNQSHHNFF